MTQLKRTERTRQLIHDSLQRHGADQGIQARETLLIKAGNYCGHRIKQGDVHAVWFVEEDEVKIFGPEGLLETFCPTERLSQPEFQRAAA